jgi:hypothetical protein
MDWGSAVGAAAGTLAIASGLGGAGVSKMVNSRQPAARAATINKTLSHFITFMSRPFDSVRSHTNILATAYGQCSFPQLSQLLK